MKECLYRVIPLIATCLLVLVLVLTGCAAQNNTSGGQAGPASAASDASEQPPSPSGTAPSPESSEAPSSAQSLVSESPEPETECNWTLEVGDTVTAKVNGYDFTCTLSIMAVKLGGTDELGTYRGIVTLDYKYDMKQGSISGNAAGGGQEIDAVIEVVSYDAQKFDDSAGQTELTQLVAYDAMAIGSLSLTGSGTANEEAGGASWATGESKTVSVPYRMAVDGGQVTIELINVAPGVQFKGMITGTPI